jgi:hypothetical protein
MSLFGDMPVMPFLVIVGGGGIAALFFAVAIIWWGLRYVRRKRASGDSAFPPSGESS